MEAQIDRLTADEQRALEAASVSGVTFSASVAAAGADLALEATGDVCNDLARRSHLIRAAGFAQFADGIESSRYQRHRILALPIESCPWYATYIVAELSGMTLAS